MDETRHSPLEDLLPWALPAEGDNPAVSLRQYARSSGLVDSMGAFISTNIGRRRTSSKPEPVKARSISELALFT